MSYISKQTECQQKISVVPVSALFIELGETLGAGILINGKVLHGTFGAVDEPRVYFYISGHGDNGAAIGAAALAIAPYIEPAP